MFVQKVAAFGELEFIDLKRKSEENVALKDQLANSLWVHPAIIEPPIEAAKAGTWRTANNNVRLFFLNEASRFSSICCQEEIPTATITVLPQVEGLAWCKVQMRQLGELGCNSRRRVQLCNLGSGHLKLCSQCQEELDDLVGFATFCCAGVNSE